MNQASEYDVAVVGGAGHVGAPLSIVLADRGLRTLIVDHDEKALATIQAGSLPFVEEDGERLLRKALKQDMLGFTAKPDGVTSVPIIIVTIGTPIDTAARAVPAGTGSVWPRSRRGRTGHGTPRCRRRAPGHA